MLLSFILIIVVMILFIKTTPYLPRNLFNNRLLINYKLDSNLKKIAKTVGPNSSIQLAIYSKRDNETYFFSIGNKKEFDTASIVKVAILTKLLHDRQNLKNPLNNEEKDWAQASIRESDNSKTTNLYLNSLGGEEALNNLFHELKMKNSYASSVGWTVTKTTASDQLKLLNNIFYDSNYLSDNSKRYIIRLMDNVIPSQQWGVSSYGTPFQNKNGWQEIYHNEGWTINSIGHVGSGEKSFTIAVLTSGNKSKQDGIKLIDLLLESAKKQLK